MTPSKTMLHRTLEQDLAKLKADYALDDSLIESLTASPEQARAHIRFWTRTMWFVNLGGIILCLCLAGVTAHFGEPGIRLTLYLLSVICILIAITLVITLRRQKRALADIKAVAKRHSLI